jgi:hypothetical protein
MAKKVKSQAKPKKQADKFLAKVPAEYVFWCHDGNIFGSMKELAEGMSTMSDEVFTYHSNSEKQDFSNWVKDVIKDEKLAGELAVAINRLQAAEYVAARVAFLTGKVA